MPTYFTHLRGIFVIALGATLISNYAIHKYETIWMLLIGVFVLLCGYRIIYNALKYRYENLVTQENYASRSFAWYIESNPQAFTNNQIACNQCGSKAIIHQRDTNANQKQIFGHGKHKVYNRHACKQCASILFFTPIND